MIQHEPRWLNDNQQALWRLMLDAIRKLERDIEDTLQAEAELTSPEFAVLVVLSESEDEQARIREICTHLNWDRSRASHQLSRMQRRGLIEKTKCVGDGRGVVVIMTEEGKRRLKQAVPMHVESVNRLIFDHMSNDQAHHLDVFFRHVLQAQPTP